MAGEQNKAFSKPSYGVKIIRTVTDASGLTVWQRHYTSYGERLVDVAANYNQAGFTGHIRARVGFYQLSTTGNFTRYICQFAGSTARF